MNELANLEKLINSLVAEGFMSPHQIIDEACAFASEHPSCAVTRGEASQLVAAAIESHRLNSGTWDGETDCDRLDAAFQAINAKGIVARQHFSCCNNCGFTEIWDEIEKEEAEGKPVYGYVFYHLQCTQHAMKTGELFMAFGSIEDEESALQQVVDTILVELGRAGLRASWAGSTNHPIVIRDLVWRRRI